MGNKNSNPAAAEKAKKEVANFDTGYFTKDEAAGLHQLYHEISASIDDNGLITKDEFQKALQLKPSIFVDRMFAIFDDNGDDFITEEEFIQGLSIFSKNCPRSEKILFSFKMYDADGDGTISKTELLNMFEAHLGAVNMRLSDEQKMAIVDATFAEADADGDDTISQEEYKSMIERHPNMLSNMTINFEALF